MFKAAQGDDHPAPTEACGVKVEAGNITGEQTNTGRASRRKNKRRTHCTENRQTEIKLAQEAVIKPCCAPYKQNSSEIDGNSTAAEIFDQTFGARPKTTANWNSRYSERGSSVGDEMATTPTKRTNYAGDVKSVLNKSAKDRQFKHHETFESKHTCNQSRGDGFEKHDFRKVSKICLDGEGKQMPDPSILKRSETKHGKKGKGKLDLNKLKKANTGQIIKNKLCSEKNGEKIHHVKQHPAKPTFLYVVIGDRIHKPNDLKQFLFHRMGNPTALNFEVVDTSFVKNSIITAKFESYKKASAARHLLHASNRNVSSKVRCFFNLAEAEGQEVDNTKERKNKLERTSKEIDELTEQKIHMHDAKIHDVRESLSLVKKELGKKRGVPLSNFEKFLSEKSAFENRLRELEGQRKEFITRIHCMKKELANLITCDRFNYKMKEIRKALGIETRRLAASLPIYARRDDILTTVREKQVCVILGETGSGKSTQIVQYLYQAGFAADGLIACTQPRKIAAVSLATYVASELASNVGQAIGYKVGMQTKLTSVTKVLFMTDHILLNECLNDRQLTEYSCIIIDEAHERSIHTDLLLGMLKEAFNHRSDLRVVITSATVDPNIFVQYFGGSEICPVLRVSGRTFPVDVLWEQTDTLDNPFPEDYESKALNKAIEIHLATNIQDGDILVFVTAAAETDRCVEKLKKQVGEKDILCLQLHGKLRAEEQRLVFERTPKGKRKIVFATNCAETSLTIPGIKFVVDTGVVKEMRFDPKKNMNSLDVLPVSQSSANQRRGRAGRTTSGICYRLYTEEDYNRMDKIANPEILRIQVSQALLKLMELGVDPLMFDYVQSPSNVSMQSAIAELQEIGAIDESGLSGLGKWIAKLPIEPRLGFLIKTGIDMEITTEAVVVASCCNQTGIFFRVGTQDEKKESDINKTKFCHQNGDLLTMLNVYREWDKVQEKEKAKWCMQNCINGKVMKLVRETINEIISILRKDVNINIKHQFKCPNIADPQVQKLLFKSLTSKLGYYLGHEKAGYLIINSSQRVQIHPSSSLISLGYHPTWVVFYGVLKTSTDFVTGVTTVSDEAINEAVKMGKVCIDLKFLESQKIILARQILVGKHVYWKFVGPMHKKRQEVEEKIGMTCDNSLAIIDTNKKRGELSLFCLPEHEDKAVAMMRSVLEVMPQELLTESKEISIGSEKSGVRAVLREGGAAVDVLMPNEYRSMKIWQKMSTIDYDITEDSARELFEFYGPVEQIWRPIRKRRRDELLWGKVTYINQADASFAETNINTDSEIEITLEPVTFNNVTTASRQEFKMKLRWCRRPSKGHCYVYAKEQGDIQIILDASLMIDGEVVDVSPSKEQSDLYITGLLPEVTEDQVKEALLEVLGMSLDSNCDRFKVIIPRVNAVWNADEWLCKQEELSRIVSIYARNDSFRVHVRQYKPKTVMCTAFVTFSDLQMLRYWKRIDRR